MNEEQWTDIDSPHSAYHVQISNSGSHRHRLAAGTDFGAVHANGYAQVLIEDVWQPGLPAAADAPVRVAG